MTAKEPVVWTTLIVVLASAIVAYQWIDLRQRDGGQRAGLGEDAFASASLSPPDAPGTTQVPTYSVSVSQAGAPDGRLSGRADIAQTEMSIAVDESNPARILIAANVHSWAAPPEGTGATSRVRLGWYWSLDGGQSWDAFDDEEAGPVYIAVDPSVAIRAADGAFLVNGITRGHPEIGGGQGLRYSFDNGGTWQSSQIAIPPNMSPTTEKENFDKNHLCVDNSPTSPYFGRVYVAWTSFDGVSLSTPIQVSHSDDLSTWSSPTTISSPDPPGEFPSNNGVNLATSAEGTVHAIWAVSDNGNSSGDRAEDAFGYSRSFDGGATWEPARRIMDGMNGHRGIILPLDYENFTGVHNVRHNSLPSMRVDRSGGAYEGSVYVVWTNRGVPNQAPTEDLEIYCLVSRDGGGVFAESEPVRVNQDSTENAQYFPWLALDQSSGVLGVAYHDRRGAGDSNEDTTIYSSISVDGGVSWVDQRVGDATFKSVPMPGVISNDPYAGDYIGAALLLGDLHLCWADPRLGDGRYVGFVETIDARVPSPSEFSNISTNGDVGGARVLDYAGEPYASASADLNGDGREDLVLTQSPGRAEFYENFGTLGGEVDAPDFQVVEDVMFVGGLPPRYGHGIAVADFDDANGPDVVVLAGGGPGTDEAPGIFQNQGTNPATFVNYGSTLSSNDALVLSDALQDSWAATWIDYDGQAPLDLFIGRAVVPAGTPPRLGQQAVTEQTPVLLRGSYGSGGEVVFEDVSSSSGIILPSDPAIICMATTWGDVNDDGHTDIVAGDMRPLLSGTERLSRLYIGSASGTFTESWSAYTGGSLGSVNSVELRDVDLDVDSSLDLIVNIQDSAFKGPFVYLNGESGSFSSLVKASDDVPAGSRVTFSSVVTLDQDGDCYPDLLGLPIDDLDSPQLFINEKVSGQQVFVRDPTAAGLTETGAVFGAVVADFDGDPGSPADLYLGRSTSTEAFFYRSESNPSAGTIPSAINIRLAGGGGNPTDGHGAKIVVKDNGTVVGTQILGAGVGRGGQSPALSTFGLGDGDGAYDVEISWPDGGTQTHSVFPDSSYTFEDATSPTIVTSTQVAAVTLAPGVFSVEFTWETEYSSRPELDKVHISAASGCWSGGVWIRATDPDVEHSVERMTNGRYQHRIRKDNISCSGGCIYTYYCSSATDFVSSDAANDPKTFKTLFCISGM